ncbi:type 11 methyltransferase [Caballeronia udeis]|uniref:Type 11 methyltransferase n=1 Tax=Caballeronia udeis TaxID=1232866 RepID=A0A158F2K2_9BURK|nr:hypothetical protein [Caballeronia udeis]SAL13935.1 type 11 methyltransferase [Caballeronia udeis]
MDNESVKPTGVAVTGTVSPPGVREPANTRSEQAEQVISSNRLDLAEAEAARAKRLLALADIRVEALEALVRELQTGGVASGPSDRYRVRDLEAQLRLAQSRAMAAEKSAEQAQLLTEAMFRSTSWRFSSPVRAGGTAMRRIGGSGVVAKTMARRVVLHGAAYIRNRPALKEGIVAVLARFPGIRARLIRLAGFDAVQGMLAGAPMPDVETVDRLTARGRRIHADLLSARNIRSR